MRGKFSRPEKRPQAPPDPRQQSGGVATCRQGRGRPRLPEAERKPALSRALDRGLVLFALVGAEGEINLTSLAATAGMAPSTAHRMLETLRLRGLVAFDESRQLWSIGVEAFRIGHAYARRANYLEAGRIAMQRLTEQTGETSSIAVIEGQAVVYVAQIETRAPIRAFVPPGARGELAASGIGKALLAWMSGSRRRALVSGISFERFTAHTIMDMARLEAELDTIRARGWAIDDEERHQGMRCIAAPIFDEYGQAIAGISVSGPVSRFDHAMITRAGPRVRAAADAVTTRIGGCSS